MLHSLDIKVEAAAVQLHGELRAPVAMKRVVPVVQASLIMEEREEAHDIELRTARRRQPLANAVHSCRVRRAADALPLEC
jgi:hypothetical protein